MTPPHPKPDDRASGEATNVADPKAKISDAAGRSWERVVLRLALVFVVGLSGWFAFRAVMRLHVLPIAAGGRFESTLGQADRPLYAEMIEIVVGSAWFAAIIYGGLFGVWLLAVLTLVVSNSRLKVAPPAPGHTSAVDAVMPWRRADDGTRRFRVHSVITGIWIGGGVLYFFATVTAFHRMTGFWMHDKRHLGPFDDDELGRFISQLAIGASEAVSVFFVAPVGLLTMTLLLIYCNTRGIKI